MAKLTVHCEEKAFFWGPDLTLAREAMGLSQEEFAEKCGWTQQNQMQLELPGIKHKLDNEKREAFIKAGIYIFNS